MAKGGETVMWLNTLRFFFLNGYLKRPLGESILFLCKLTFPVRAKLDFNATMKKWDKYGE